MERPGTNRNWLSKIVHSLPGIVRELRFVTNPWADQKQVITKSAGWVKHTLRYAGPFGQQRSVLWPWLMTSLLSAAPQLAATNLGGPYHAHGCLCVNQGHKHSTEPSDSLNPHSIGIYKQIVLLWKMVVCSCRRSLTLYWLINLYVGTWIVLFAL